MHSTTIPAVRRFLTAADGPAYDDARRVFNAMYDRRPQAIAQVASAQEVVAALHHARANGLRVAVRAGGHSVAGYSTVDDGLVIDLRPIDHVDVDPVGRTARVGAGVDWGRLDAATQAHGLATTGGRMTTTGVAGFTLGSGSGWLERLHGLACDNLLSAQVVTADGRVLTASESENPDLFWGLRGGGGNFGIVTEFTFRLHPVGPTVVAGMLMHPGPQAPAVLRFFRDFMEQAPREVCGGAILMTAPPAPFVPAELHGQQVLTLLVGHFGPVDEGEAALRPLRELASAVVDLVAPRPYVELQAMTDPGNPPGRRNYWRSGALGALPDDAIDTFLACGDDVTSPFSVQVLGRAGGAIADVPEDATAISGRTAQWQFHCYGSWEEPTDEPHVEWVRRTEQAMRPWVVDGLALNFFSSVDDDLVRRTFGAEKFARLVALKTAYDPENVFRLNQNIPPQPQAQRLGSSRAAVG